MKKAIEPLKKTGKRLLAVFPAYLCFSLCILINDFGNWDSIIAKWLLLTIILIVLVLCTFLIYYIMTKRRTNDSEESQ